MDKTNATPVVAGGSAIRTVGIFPSRSHVVSTVFGGKRDYNPETRDDASKAALRKAHLTKLVQIYNAARPNRPALLVDEQYEFQDMTELNRSFTVVRADSKAAFLHSLQVLGRLSFAHLD